jgi:hypothetical protein
MEEQITEKIVRHPDVRNFMREFINGTNNWLRKTLGSLSFTVSFGSARNPKTLEGSFYDYICRHYQGKRRFKLSNLSYVDYLVKDEDVPFWAMQYLTKTLISKFNGNHVAANIAILITLERREGEYDKFYAEQVTVQPMGTNDALILFYSIFM